MVTLTLPVNVTSVVAVPRSLRVAAGLEDGHVAIWSPNEGATSLLLRPHTARVLALGTSADGTELVSVAGDGTIARTPITPGATPVSVTVDLGPAPPRAAACSAEGSRIVIGGEKGELRVFDSRTGGRTAPARAHRAELMALAFQPGSSVVASASAEADLCLWDAASGREIRRLDCGLSLWALVFSPDGTLAAGGVARRLTLYGAKVFEPTTHTTLEAPNMIASLAWSADGRLVAIGHVDSDTLGKGGVRVVDASTRAVVTTIDTGGSPTFKLAFGGADSVVGAFGRELRAWSFTRG